MDLSEAQTAVIRPGDTLVIAVPVDKLSSEVVRHLKMLAEEELPGVRVVVVNASQLAVYRPNADG